MAENVILSPGGDDPTGGVHTDAQTLLCHTPNHLCCAAPGPQFSVVFVNVVMLWARQNTEGDDFGSYACYINKSREWTKAFAWRAQRRFCRCEALESLSAHLISLSRQTMLSELEH